MQKRPCVAFIAPRRTGAFGDSRSFWPSCPSRAFLFGNTYTTTLFGWSLNGICACKNEEARYGTCRSTGPPIRQRRWCKKLCTFSSIIREDRCGPIRIFPGRMAPSGRRFGSSNTVLGVLCWKWHSMQQRLFIHRSRLIETHWNRRCCLVAKLNREIVPWEG